MNSDQTQIDETRQPRSVSRRGVVIAGGVAAVALLGGAAYVASQMFNQSKPQAVGGGQMILQGGAPGAGGQIREFKMPKIKPAPELPASEPDLAGLYLRRQDNSVFIGTGEIEVMVQRDETGKTASKANHSGPDVEVVVTAVDPDNDVSELTFSGMAIGCTGNIDMPMTTLLCPQVATYTATVTVEDPDGGMDSLEIMIAPCMDGMAP